MWFGNYAFIPGKESHELSWGGRLFLSTALLLHWAQWLGQAWAPTRTAHVPAVVTSCWRQAYVRLAPDWRQNDEVPVNQSQTRASIYILALIGPLDIILWTLITACCPGPLLAEQGPGKDKYRNLSTSSIFPLQSDFCTKFFDFFLRSNEYPFCP